MGVFVIVYQAEVVRQAPWWIVTVNDIGGAAQARSLAEAQRLACQQIASARGVDVNNVEVKLQVNTVGDLTGIQDTMNDIVTFRAEASRLAEKASQEAIQLAKRLSRCGVTVRDIGHIMGVSHQRAHQLVSMM